MDAQVTNQGLWSAFQGGRLLAVCLFVSDTRWSTGVYFLDPDFVRFWHSVACIGDIGEMWRVRFRGVYISDPGAWQMDPVDHRVGIY